MNETQPPVDTAAAFTRRMLKKKPPENTRLSLAELQSLFGESLGKQVYQMLEPPQASGG